MSSNKKVSNEMIFKITGIMLHPRKHNTINHKEYDASYEISYFDRDRFGYAVKEAGAWRFIGLDRYQYGANNLSDVSDALKILNANEQ